MHPPGSYRAAEGRWGRGPGPAQGAVHARTVEVVVSSGRPKRARLPAPHSRDGKTRKGRSSCPIARAWPGAAMLSQVALDRPGTDVGACFRATGIVLAPSRQATADWSSRAPSRCRIRQGPSGKTIQTEQGLPHESLSITGRRLRQEECPGPRCTGSVAPDAASTNGDRAVASRDRARGRWRDLRSVLDDPLPWSVLRIRPTGTSGDTRCMRVQPVLRSTWSKLAPQVSESRTGCRAPGGEAREALAPVTCALGSIPPIALARVATRPPTRADPHPRRPLRPCPKGATLGARRCHLRDDLARPQA
jgi:hypothetical protein